jgi:hypothetical protein
MRPRSVGITPGDHDVGVMREPVDGRGGEGLGHDLVEARRMGVAADRERVSLVGGVDHDQAEAQVSHAPRLNANRSRSVTR